MKSFAASGRKETRRKAPAADTAFREARKSSTVSYVFTQIRLRPYASTDQCVHRRPRSEVLCDGLNAFDIFASCPYTALNGLRRSGLLAHQRDVAAASLQLAMSHRNLWAKVRMPSSRSKRCERSRQV